MRKKFTTTLHDNIRKKHNKQKTLSPFLFLSTCFHSLSHNNLYRCLCLKPLPKVYHSYKLKMCKSNLSTKFMKPGSCFTTPTGFHTQQKCTKKISCKHRFNTVTIHLTSNLTIFLVYEVFSPYSCSYR